MIRSNTVRRLRTTQARVLTALMPISGSKNLPVLTKVELAARAGFRPGSGTINCALHGIRPGSSSGKPHKGLLALGLITEIPGFKKPKRYQITTAGINAIKQHPKLPKLRDKDSCINNRYLLEEAADSAANDASDSGTSHSLQDGHEDEQSALDILEKHPPKGQGFRPNTKLRRALEQYAMDAARAYFASKGFVVEDRSRNRSYDLHCRCGNQVLYVEVKGTQTRGEKIILTTREVKFARSHKGEMALFVFHSIRVIDTGGDFPSLAGGIMRLIHPWDVDQGSLSPLSFMYRIPR